MSGVHPLLGVARFTFPSSRIRFTINWSSTHSRKIFSTFSEIKKEVPWKCDDSYPRTMVSIEYFASVSVDTLDR